MSASLRVTSCESRRRPTRMARWMSSSTMSTARSTSRRSTDSGRTGAQKLGEQRGDHQPAHQAWRTDPNASRWLVTVVRQRRLDLPDLTDDRLGALVQKPALVGERELARGAQQQAGPEMLLQR